LHQRDDNTHILALVTPAHEIRHVTHTHTKTKTTRILRAELSYRIQPSIHAGRCDDTNRLRRCGISPVPRTYVLVTSCSLHTRRVLISRCGKRPATPRSLFCSHRRGHAQWPERVASQAMHRPSVEHCHAAQPRSLWVPSSFEPAHARGRL